jgi:heme o synthase
MKKWIKLLLELSKLRITFVVTLTTATGYILRTGAIDLKILVPIFGVFLLAGGASALNHYQERSTDALMPRTKNRPLPSGRVTPLFAVSYAVLQIWIGSMILLVGANFQSMVLGFAAVIWYNLVYTYLKKFTAFAVVPGSLIGSLPPMIGWTAAGGDIFDPRIMVVAAFFFIWQVPHFWLLLLVFGKDYAKAGLPTLTDVFSTPQLARLTFVWILATAASCALFPMFGVLVSSPAIIIMLLAVLWMAWQGSRLITAKEQDFPFRASFMKINFFMLAIITLLSLDSIFSITL